MKEYIIRIPENEKKTLKEIYNSLEHRSSICAFGNMAIGSPLPSFFFKARLEEQEKSLLVLRYEAKIYEADENTVSTKYFIPFTEMFPDWFIEA